MRPLIWKAPVIFLFGGFLFYGCATTNLVNSPEEKKELAQQKFRKALQFASLKLNLSLEALVCNKVNTSENGFFTGIASTAIN